MSFKYEKVEDNIYKYQTKSGKVKYRVKITIEYIPFDKSGLNNISAARAFIKQATADVLNGDYAQKKKDFTFAEYWGYYLKQKTTPKGSDKKSDWNRSTAATNIANFTNHIMPAFSDRKLDDVTRIEFEQFADDLIKVKKLRTSTADFVITLLQNMLTHAEEYEVISRNRSRKVKAPSSSLPPIDKELNPNDYAKLAEFYDQQQISIKVRFDLLSLGLRRAEVTGLRVGSLDFFPNFDNPESVRILIDKSRPNEYIKEGKSTKTNKSRIVYANQRIAINLRDYILWLKGRLAEENKTLHKENWLIVGSYDLEPIHTNTIYAYMVRVGKKLGVYVTPHMLRHHFATRAKLDGVDARYVADVLGHQSLATTEGYTHGEDESAKLLSQRITFL